MISNIRKHSVIVGLIGALAFPATAAVNSSNKAFPEGDRLIYGRLVQAYRKSQLDEVTRQRQLLERNYPSSVHLDNGLYLQGMLEFQNALYGESIRTFNQISGKFKNSNKRPAALFAKGVAYERLNIKPLAKKTWNTVIKEYPGSPESQRAWMHLRMEKVTK